MTSVASAKLRYRITCTSSKDLMLKIVSEAEYNYHVSSLKNWVMLYRYRMNAANGRGTLINQVCAHNNR